MKGVWVLVGVLFLVRFGEGGRLVRSAQGEGDHGDEHHVETSQEEVLKEHKLHEQHEEENHKHVEHQPGSEDTVLSESLEEEAQVKINGFGEDCLEENTKCNDIQGLVCSRDLGKCECASGTVHSHETKKCEVVSEPKVEDNEERAEENPTTEAVPVKVIETHGEEHVHHDEEHHGHQHTDGEKHEGHHHHNHGQDGGHHHQEEPHDEEHHHNNDEYNHGNEHVHSEAHNDRDSGEQGVNKELNVPAVAVNKCENLDCSEKLGEFSKCDENTGECICHDMGHQPRPVLKVNGKCYLERKINDTCTEHEDCSAVIKGKAWCHMDTETLKRYCTCEVLNYFDTNLQECLPLAKNGVSSNCKTDAQCTGDGVTGQGLGRFSRCSKDTNLCECLEGPDGQKGFFYENYCYYKLEFGDTCETTKGCQLSLPDKDVECSELTKTCSCKLDNLTPDCPLEAMGRALLPSVSEDPKGEDEDGGVIHSMKAAMGIDVSNFVFIMIIAAVVILAVVILSVFIMRKRHRYSVVRTQP